MQQTLNGQFRNVQVGGNLLPYNIIDLPGDPLVGPVNVSVWSRGARLIDTIESQPNLGYAWSIIGWTIVVYGVFVVVSPANGGGPSFGKLGKLIGGVLSGPSAIRTQGSGTFANNPWVSPVRLPTDMSTLEILWDGENDPLFPFVTSPFTDVNFYPVSKGIVLPQPLTVRNGDSIAMSLFITPMLAQNMQMSIMGGYWSIVYETVVDR